MVCPCSSVPAALALVRCARRGVALAVLLLLAAASPAAGQGVVRAAAAPEYRARGPFGWLVRLIYGNQHRDLWAAPVEVPLLPLDGEAFELEAVDTALLAPYLTARSEAGERMLFAPLDPRFRDLLVPVVPHSLVAISLQDVISARHPGAPLVASRLAASAGLAWTPVSLRYLPARYAPGPRFADQIGYVTPESAAETLTAQAVLDSLNARANFPLDTLAYARERLLDLWLVAVDEQPDLARWERGPAGWRPGPRLRRQALARYGGILSAMTQPVLPSRTSFGEEPERFALTQAQELLDDRLIAPLAPATLVRAAAAIATIPDAAVDSALAALPGGWNPRPDRLRAQLIARRDSLAVTARAFHARLLEDVSIRTDPDAARVDAGWLDGTLVITAGVGSARRFDGAVTGNVRLHVGPATATVRLRGDARAGPALTIVGTRPLVVVDSARHAHVEVYDPFGVTVAPADGDVDIRTAPYDEIDLRWSRLRASLLDREPRPPTGTLPGVWADFTIGADYGLLAGAGPSWTRLEEGREPFAWRFRTRLSFGTRASRWRAQAEYDYRLRNAPARILVEGMVSGIEVVRFFGYGNETPFEAGDADLFLRHQKHYLASVSAGWALGRGSAFAGPVLRYVGTDAGPAIDTLATFVGLDGFGQIGVRAGLAWDTRDFPRAPTRGLNATAGASWYPAIWDVEEAFGTVHGAAGTHLTPFRWLTWSPRIGIKRVWGGYPVHESAFLGGYETMRGLLQNRYAGDTSAWLNTDTRLTLTTIPVLVDWDFGVLGVYDVGRVWLDDEHSERWHTAWGAGLFAILPDRTFSGVGYLMFSEGLVSVTGGIEFFF